MFESMKSILLIDYTLNRRLITAGTNNKAIVDVHAVAEFGASGIFVSFPAKSLQPLPSQEKQ